MGFIDIYIFYVRLYILCQIVNTVPPLRLFELNDIDSISIDSLEAVDHSYRVRLSSRQVKYKKNICCSALQFVDCVSQVAVTSNARLS